MAVPPSLFSDAHIPHKNALWSRGTDPEGKTDMLWQKTSNGEWELAQWQCLPLTATVLGVSVVVTCVHTLVEVGAQVCSGSVPYSNPLSCICA